MITKLNLNKIEEEGFDYIMGVKVRQDEICGMLFSQSEGKNFEDYKDLKIREEKIKIKEFLIWKIKYIFKEKGVVIIDGKFDLLEKEIMDLDNKQEPTYQRYKSILHEITKEIDPKVCQKIFRAVKKYFGKYDEQLRYVICLNNDRKKIARKRRGNYISKCSKELDTLFSEDKGKYGSVKIEKSLSKIFEGYKAKFRKFFKIQRNVKTGKAIGYTLDQKQIAQEEKLDGIFTLLTKRNDLDKTKVIDSYKNLKEIEILFDDLKHFVDIRPIRHWLEIRVRGHVFICILGLLLKRIFEINYMGCKSVTEPLEEIGKSKLVKYKVKFSEREDRSKIFLKVTNTTPIQKKYFNLIGIKSPMSLEQFIW
jgi:transposase